MDIFSHAHQQRLRSEAPLAARLRQDIDKALERCKLCQKKTILLVKDVLQTLN